MDNVLDVKRKEMKYRISLSASLQAQWLFGQMIPGDKNNGVDGYMVRSLYFDSINDIDLSEKQDGVENRKKIRLRIYSPDDQNAKLELKEKQGVWQRKQSLTLPRDIAILVSTGDYRPLAEMEHPLAQELYYYMTEHLYRPKCIVQYRRYAFVVPTNDIRITFDRYLEASEGNLDLFGDGTTYYPIDTLDDVTLEVKYNHFLFSYIKDLLDGIDKEVVSYSKYVMSRYISHSIER